MSTKLAEGVHRVICDVCKKSVPYDVRRGRDFKLGSHHFITFSAWDENDDKRLFLDFCTYECCMFFLCGGLPRPKVFGRAYRVVALLRQQEWTTIATLAELEKTTPLCIRNTVRSIRAMGTIKIESGQKGLKFVGNNPVFVPSVMPKPPKQKKLKP